MLSCLEYQATNSRGSQPQAVWIYRASIACLDYWATSSVLARFKKINSSHKIALAVARGSCICACAAVGASASSDLVNRPPTDQSQPEAPVLAAEPANFKFGDTSGPLPPPPACRLVRRDWAGCPPADRKFSFSISTQKRCDCAGMLPYHRGSSVTQGCRGPRWQLPQKPKNETKRGCPDHPDPQTCPNPKSTCAPVLEHPWWSGCELEAVLEPGSGPIPSTSEKVLHALPCPLTHQGLARYRLWGVWWCVPS